MKERGGEKRDRSKGLKGEQLLNRMIVVNEQNYGRGWDGEEPV